MIDFTADLAHAHRRDLMQEAELTRRARRVRTARRWHDLARRAEFRASAAQALIH